jgi:ribosomal protein L7Ae-like RNA K-turn-binding protein
LKRNSVLSLISIAKKAGKIAAGEYQTETAVKSGKACLVIISEEASENTKKKFRNMGSFYEVPVRYYGTKVELGAAIGCEFRASMAVTDLGLAQSIEKKMAGEQDGGLVNGENQDA